mgnify:CR=1
IETVIYNVNLFFWLGGRVVMQRIANPSTPVRFRPEPPLLEQWPYDFSGLRPSRNHRPLTRPTIFAYKKS